MRAEQRTNQPSQVWFWSLALLVSACGAKSAGTAEPTCGSESTPPAYRGTKVITGNGAASVLALAVNDVGSLAMSGRYSGSIDLDPASPLSPIGAPGIAGRFVAIFASTGDLIWVRTWGEATEIFPVTFGADGTVVLAGAASGNEDLDPGPEVFPIGAMGRTPFVIKLDASGNRVWIRSLQGNDGSAEVFGVSFNVAVLGNGAVFLGGEVQGAPDFSFGQGPAKRVIVTRSSIFVAALTKDGAPLAGHVFEPSDDSYFGELAPSLDGRHVWLAGRFIGTLPTAGRELVSNGMDDALVTTFNDQGVIERVITFGGPGYDSGDRVLPLESGFAVAGRFNQTVDFDWSTGEHFTSAPHGDAWFLARWDDAGAEPLWVKPFRGDWYAVQLARAPRNGVLVLGGFTGSVSPGELDDSGGVMALLGFDRHGDTRFSFSTGPSARTLVPWGAVGSGCDAWLVGEFRGEADFAPAGSTDLKRPQGLEAAGFVSRFAF